ncbi:hypothetical protein CGZ93_06730 [Enemella dayhoffiae]|uniref:Transcriptional regulator, AbiEi antitoxin, Type IV TA system n=1 Tax=Enemella dayhoffiae TaxID=2016507 RepID=A0A255H737_9ACTN|nr:type IV toxin-antitoxin system AbiEi family antitoxin domain-containing protein [Enemella dayhoffiae]OYO23146.1 hypothetical protein CGZ93_06730 [Enemella dayhoffiae]
MDEWVFTTEQLTEMGWNTEKIRSAVRGGEFVRIRNGFYRPGTPADEFERQDWTPEDYQLRHRCLIQAAGAVISDDTVLSHRSAAVLHGLPLPPGLLRRVDLLRDGVDGARRTPTAHHRRAPLPTDDRTVIEGLPVTGLARTVADLIRTLPFRDALAVLDVGLARGVTAAELGVRLKRRAIGNPQARQLLELGDEASESPGESRCRATMALAGIPRPVCQFVVADTWGREIARCDFAWPDLGLVGEFDGLTKYGRLLKPGQSSNDAIRDERLREARIRNAGLWCVRWIDAELRDLNRFREGFRDAARCARTLRDAA